MKTQSPCKSMPNMPSSVESSSRLRRCCHKASVPGGMLKRATMPRHQATAVPVWCMVAVRRAGSEPELAEAGVVVGPAAQRPMEQALSRLDRQVVDAGKAALHQALGVELPVFIAIAAIPLARIVMPLVGKAHGQTFAGEGPQFLDQAVVQLAGPFALEELAGLLAPHREFGPVAPHRVLGVDLGHAGRVAGVPGV